MAIPSNAAIIVDIDLIFYFERNTYHINTSLMNALKDISASEIYLFSNISLADMTVNSSYLSIPSLIEALKEEGIEVIEVLSPADIVYNKGPGRIYSNIFLKHCRRISNYHGKDYSQEEKFISDNEKFNKYLLSVSRIISEEDRYPATEKSKLFEYFLNNKRYTIQQFIVIDDPRHLKAIENAFQFEQYKSKMKLACIPANKKSTQTYFERQMSSILLFNTFRAKMQRSLNKHPYFWGTLKWLAIGAVSAVIIYFTCGAIAPAYLAKLGAWAIPALTPILAIVEATLTKYIFAPFIKFCRNCKSREISTSPEPIEKTSTLSARHKLARSLDFTDVNKSDTDFSEASTVPEITTISNMSSLSFNNIYEKERTANSTSVQALRDKNDEQDELNEFIDPSIKTKDSSLHLSK